MNWISFSKSAGRGMAKEIMKIYNSEQRHKQHGRGKGGDITIEGDRVAEEVLIRRLQELGMNIFLISEEVGELKIGKFKRPQDADFTVIADPLDGSFNFQHRMDHFASSIAVLDKNYNLMAGYIRDIPKKIEYTAEKGRGAYMDDRKLKTRRDAEKANILLECSPACSRGDIGFLSMAFLNTRRARAYGSVALDMCRVADGTFHSFLYAGCSRFLDLAAGILMVREAGGVVTDFNGNEQLTKGTKLVAKNLLASGNRGIHEKLLRHRFVVPKK